MTRETILPPAIHDTIATYYIGAPRDFLVRLALLAFDAGRNVDALRKLYFLLVEADNAMRDREGVGIGHWIKPANEKEWEDSIKWLRDAVTTKVDGEHLS